MGEKRGLGIGDKAFGIYELVIVKDSLFYGGCQEERGRGRERSHVRRIKFGRIMEREVEEGGGVQGCFSRRADRIWIVKEWREAVGGGEIGKRHYEKDANNSSQ